MKNLQRMRMVYSHKTILFVLLLLCIMITSAFCADDLEALTKKQAVLSIF